MYGCPYIASECEEIVPILFSAVGSVHVWRKESAFNILRIYLFLLEMSVPVFLFVIAFLFLFVQEEVYFTITVEMLCKFEIVSFPRVVFAQGRN